MNLLIKITTLIFCLISLSACRQHSSSSETIGIIVPLEHTAMNEIVAGFSETLHEMYKKPVEIKVENAQGDPNLERAIIQKMRDAHYSLIVPIGTSATQMSLSMVHHQPIVSLASDLSETDRKQLQFNNVTVVHDEILPKQLIEFIHSVYPTLTQLTLIHSTADKVFNEVAETISAGKNMGIHVNPIMVSSLSELYSAANALPQDAQGIFVLKDSLIVSGISTLSKLAAQKHIPLITSDQGSVQDGAGFALGVHEREIGVEGAKLATQVLRGKPIEQLAVAEMKNLTVFINQAAIQQEAQSQLAIIAAAKRLSYPVEVTDKESLGKDSSHVPKTRTSF